MRRKLVGIDARMWTHPGIGRYLRELSHALLRIAPPDRFLFFGDESLLRPALGPDASIAAARSPIYGIAEQLEMARLSRSAEVLHVPHFNAPLFAARPLVATIHDLIYLRKPDAPANPLGRVYVRTMLGNLSRRARGIIAVSEATKNDFLQFFPQTDPARITVVYEAACDRFRPMPPDAARAQWLAERGLSKPFALFVGSLKPHKNVSVFIRAMKRLREDRKLDAEAVLVGRSDPKQPQILEEVRAASGWVRHLGEVTDEELAILYNAAAALVQPSFAEGFGLPVLEAMACGTPVIVSRRASLPEIAGEAGLYFDPERVDALEELLYTIFKNQDLRQKMSPICLARAARFTWERTARQTLAVYDQAPA